MTVLLALIGTAAIGAAISAWGLARGGRSARLGAAAGMLALVVIIVLAFAMDARPIADDAERVAGSLFGGRLMANAYLRLVLGLWALMAVILAWIAVLLGGLAAVRALLPATLAAIAGAAVTLAATSMGLAAAAATATGLAAVLVVLASGGGPGLTAAAGVTAAAGELRATIGSGALLFVAGALVPVLAGVVLRGLGGGADGTSGAGAAPGEPGAVIGIVTLAGALAVGLRYGVLPFHRRVARLVDVVPTTTVPLLLAWIPLPFAVVAVAAADILIAPLALPLDGERVLIVGFALLTLLGAALAAYLQDDLRHATGYLVVADAGLLILAAAALDPAAWGPARAWIVVLAASKTALGAWAAVTEERYGTRSIPDLRGWVRRSPLLTAGLVLVTLATFGLPGWVALEARGTLASLAAEGPAAGLLVIAGFLTLPTYLRLLILGAGPVTSKVDGAAPERIIRLRRAASTDTLPVELEGEDVAAPAIPITGDPAAAAVSAVAADGSMSSATATATATVTGRLKAAARRDRTELLSAAVLALALLAALTSWGALDVGGASGEASPIVAGPSTD